MKKLFSIESENLPPILPIAMIFFFLICLWKWLFPPLILEMVENNESSSVICLEQVLSKTTCHTLLIFTHKNQDEVFGIHTLLGPLSLDVVSFGTQVMLWTLSFLTRHINQMTYYLTITVLKVRIIWLFSFNKLFFEILLIPFRLIT